MNYRIQARTMALATLTFVFADVAVGHHSFAMFDATKEVAVEGTVKEFEWTNPHTWIWVNVQEANGEATTWGAEGVSPNSLIRNGWTRTMLKPGDAVTIFVNPLLDGRRGGRFLRMTLPDGRTVDMHRPLSQQTTP
jgi:hypothetical protein